MNKPPVLSDKRMIEVARECWRTDRTYPELVAITQRDADYEHEQNTIKEIFEELYKKCSLEVQNIHSSCGWDKLAIRRCDYQSLKDRYEEKK